MELKVLIVTHYLPRLWPLMLFYFISAPMISYLKIWCDFRTILFYLFTKYKENKEKKNK
jgi:hypothetical protein